MLLGFSAYFSATETAFTSVNRIRIKNLANDGNRRARDVFELSEQFDTVLSTLLVGNNIVNIALTSLATVLCLELYPVYGATVSTIATTIVVLIFGEISPKSLAKESPEKFSMFSAPLPRFLRRLALINWLFGCWKKLLFCSFQNWGQQTDHRG